jgi:hypothetical protein
MRESHLAVGRVFVAACDRGVVGPDVVSGLALVQPASSGAS